MKKSSQFFAAIVMVLLSVSVARSHCEIPCGIYDDQMRVHMIAEHIDTIEKSMNQVVKLQSEDQKNYNQLVRWIVNKENHADKLQDILTQYFMTQRIKIDDNAYTKKLVVLHKMIVYAMKCKQTIELSHTETLRNLLKQFSELYFENSNHIKEKKE